ncbi:hypothetical protein CR513_62570, partial [Mucuna pruriens]
MRSPRNVKEVQQLVGRITGLAHFLSRPTDMALPLLQCLRKNDSFQWTEECETAFQKLKMMLATPRSSQSRVKAIVRIELPIKQVLRKPYLAGRILGWIIELSEFDISYEKIGHIKAQVLAYFIIELILVGETNGAQKEWTLSVDGASNQKESGVVIILEGQDKASNNQAEYEAILTSMKLAKELGAEVLTAKTNQRRRGCLVRSPHSNLDGPNSRLPIEGHSSKQPSRSKKIEKRGFKVEAELVVTISTKRIKKFYWKKLIFYFNLSSIIVSDNDTQFADRWMAKFCYQLRIKQFFSSIENPQTNEQAESTNKVVQEVVHIKEYATKARATR